jgi:hypothetical protein
MVTPADKEKAFLALRMIRIEKLPCRVVKEYGLRFFERDSVLLPVLAVLTLIPDKAELGHIAV